MSTSSIIVRLLIVIGVAAYMLQVLAVAVFAVPDRYDGAIGVLFSLLIVAGGTLPLALFFYLFRSYLASQGTAEVAAPEPSTLKRMTKEDLVEPISDRELEVLALLAQGKQNKQIAQELSVSLGTVKTHTNNINRKLGTTNRGQAVNRARDMGLL